MPDITGTSFSEWVERRRTKVDYDLVVQAGTPECVHSRVTNHLITIGLGHLMTFHRCACNEYMSVLQRHVVEQRPCTSDAAIRMFLVADDILSWTTCYALVRRSRTDVIATRPARMKKRYRNVKDQHVQIRTGKAFIKFEKTEMEKADEGKIVVPRMIQYRGSEYTLSLARYSTVMEEFLKCADHPGMESNDGYPFIAKGLNAKDKASLLSALWGRRKNPVAYLIDHSKFDSMVNETHQLLERYIMVKTFGECATLDWLYSNQSVNSFVSQSGIRYKFPFRRCSGDANTSLGNSLINYCILRSVYPDALILVDGDDSVVITDGYRDIPNFEEYGMNTKIDHTVVFEHIEFCQSRPVMTPEGWVMCRNPMRAISRMNMRLGPNVCQRSFLHTVGIGEGLCSSYMPIISVMARRFRELGKGGKYRPWDLDYRIKVDRWDDKFNYPTDQVRASFAVAWGICPAEQRMVESKIALSVLHHAN